MGKAVHRRPVSQEDVREWLVENGGWHTSREIWRKFTQKKGLGWEQSRKQVFILRKKGLIERRVKYANEGGHRINGSMELRTPLYEYSVLFDIDSLTE